jgi:hypothetical protein
MTEGFKQKARALKEKGVSCEKIAVELQNLKGGCCKGYARQILQELGFPKDKIKNSLARYGSPRYLRIVT